MPTLGMDSHRRKMSTFCPVFSRLYVCILLGSIALFPGLVQAQVPEGDSYSEPATAPEEAFPKTLFQWRVSLPKEDENDEPEEDHIVTDRPHFSEASSLVGLGRIQVESGFTYSLDNFAGQRSKQYSFPETLYRIGLFQEWFELRVGYNYLVETNRDQFGIQSRISGSDDLYLGAKLALTEQEGWLPEMAIFPQMRVPTGHKNFTSGEVLPGFNLAYSWKVNEMIELECNSQLNRRKDDLSHLYLEAIQTINIEYELSKQLEAFTEWFCFLPDGALASTAGPQHYLHGGFSYKFRPNVQGDIHAGFGLNDHSANSFYGAGFSFRR